MEKERLQIGYLEVQNRPLVNGTGTLLLGEAYPNSNPSGFITRQNVVFTTGNQIISGTKNFRDQVYIKDLYVTGTETIVNTTNTNVGSNYLLLNATGGAIDAGIFIVTGSGFTGASHTGAIIGYDVPANRWVFGNTSRNSDLSQLEKIAGITDISNYSGYASNTFATITNLETTGSNLNQKIDDLSGVSVLVYGNQTISGLKAFTDNINFQKNISVSGFYNFDTANTGQPFDGQMNWNPDYGTVQIGMNAGNVINPVGFKSFYRVKAAENIRKGKVVMALGGVGNSEYILAREAQNIGNSGQLIMGVSAEEILANNFGDVVAFGPVRGVNTSTYPQDSILYYDPLSTGGFTNVLPQAPNAKVLVALNTTSANNGIVFVRVTAGSELGGTDSNVKFSTLQNNDIIIYNTGSGLWFNSGVNFGNFYTRDNPSGFISQDLGTNGQLLVSNSVYSDEVGILTNADEVLVVKMGDGSFQYGGGYPGAAPISILSGSTQLPVIGIYDLPNSDYNEITWNDSLLTLRNYPDGIGNLGLGGNVQLIYNFGNDESDSVRTIAVDERVVHNFGNETISGVKDFATRPAVNGTGVVLSNEISKIIDKFTASSNQPPATGFATLDTRNSILALDYDDTVNESGTFVGMIPETAGTITGLGVRILWSATTATSGNCRWGARFADLSFSGVNAPFDLGTEVNSEANSVSGISSAAEIICSGTAGLVANEFYRLLVYRNSADTVNDTMAGDAELIGVTTYLV